MIKNFFKNNPGLKLLCLVLAVFSWYALKSEELMDKTVRVVVSPKISDNMYLLKTKPAYVQVVVTGSRRVIKEMGNFPYSIDINLSKEKEPKTFQNYLKESDFTFPETVRILKIDPEKIEIELDRLVSKYVMIQANTEGVVSPNYELARIDLIPARVKIEGPEKILNKIEVLKTENINIDGMNTNFIQEIQLVPPFSDFRASQKTVKAYVTINKSKMEKIFEGIPVRVLQPVGIMKKCSIKPSDVTLTVSASALDFQGAGKGDFTAYVDIGGLTGGVYELPVVTVKKDAYKLVEIKPKSAEVTISGAE